MSNIRLFRIPPYAVLVPLLPVFNLYARNIDRLSLAHGLWTAAAFLAGFLLLMMMLRIVIRRPERTDLLLAICFAAVFLPVNFLEPETTYLWWIGGWAALFAIALLWNESRRFLPVIVSIASFAFLAPVLMQIVISPTWQQRAEIRSVTTKAFADIPEATAAPVAKRDIYYIIFDRYARGDQLKKTYGFDNSEFLEALRKRGFFIADEAFSNYQRTTHSVISSLNFDYLESLEAAATAHKSDWLPLFDMLQEFRIGRFLKKQGYEIHFAGSWWEPTRRIASGDVFHNFYEVPELSRLIYEYSLIVKAARLAGLKQADPLWWQCQRSRLMFEALGGLGGGERPKFVLAHFLIPHPPWVTHESGRCMVIEEVMTRTRAKNYAGQITYTNSQILEMVDRLLAAPGPKPIIVLQADEGPWPKKYAGNEITVIGRDTGGTEWLKTTPDELREKMAIFSAMYLPGIDTTTISTSTSPVNTFRRILKAYFGVPVEELADRHLVFESSDNLYKFHDVTGTLLSRQLTDMK